jgi:hypothetical protein
VVAAQHLSFGRKKMVSQTDMENVEYLAERISRTIPNILTRGLMAPFHSRQPELLFAHEPFEKQTQPAQ